MSYRLEPVAQEQLAAQLVAVMEAHFLRPDADEKNRILHLASEQISAETMTRGMAEQVGSDITGGASQ
jgi:hypothetical protein